jgi:ATP-dependent Clp protease ATP-binding subunit ClpC
MRAISKTAACAMIAILILGDFDLNLYSSLKQHHGVINVQPFVQAFSMGSATSSFVHLRSFSSLVTNNPSRSTRRNSISSNNNVLKMVIDRLSDECVAATQVAHKIGNELGLRLLNNEVLIAGTVNRPERAGRTLAKYNLMYPLVRQSAERALEQSGFRLKKNINKDTLLQNDKPLPFSEEVKLTLTEAAKIASYFDSKTIHSEHVILALMGYNYGNPIDLQRPNAPLMILRGTENVADAQFSPYDFCQDLVEDMQLPYDIYRENPVTEEVVVIGGGSGSTNTLQEVGVDLTQMALEGRLDRVFGRDKEINMALRTLGRRRKNNPCFIGDPGVGKTAIVEAIAQVLASSYQTTEIQMPNRPKLRNPFKRNDESNEEKMQGNDLFDDYNLPPCPKALAGFRLVSIDLASLVAGTRNRGDFEEKMKKLIVEASNTNVILFIDEIHNLIGTGGGGDGAMNAANLMKPALARGDLRVLGATTTTEYRRYIEKDAALERRFQPLEVVEPTVEETLEILKTIIPKYAEYHEVEYTRNALQIAAKLSDRYITDRFLPDKAIDLLDEAGSMVKMSKKFDENYFVTEDAITEVISQISGIPVGRLDLGERSKLKNLELEMGKRIKGQERAVKSVAKAIRRARSGLRDPKRPVASFLFCGPTGVGKTELCKSLADTYFGREKDIISIDMSEFMDRFATSRLIGSPPGYVGYEQGGQLTEAVRRSPHSVILFDEIEKAHEDVLNVMLQIMDEGKLTDGKGRVVSFKNSVIVMTSNIGSKKIVEMAKETSNGDVTAKSIETARVVKEELEQTWKPEILNRIDEIIIFSPLSYENLRDIASNILDEIVHRAMDAQGIKLEIDNSVVGSVTRDGSLFADQYGARPIKRAAQRYLEDTLSEAIVRDFVKEGDEIFVEMSDTKELNGILLSEDQAVVKITKYSNNSGSSHILVPVDAEGGIGGAVGKDLEWQALYGDLPSLDDDASSSFLPNEPDVGWE